MSNIIEFPSKDHFLIAIVTDDDTGEEIILLDKVIRGERSEVGEYTTMFEVINAMDAITGIDRAGGTAA